MKKFLLAILCFHTILTAVNGQEKYYYTSNSRQVELADDAIMMKEVKTKSDTRYLIKTSILSDGGKDGKWTMSEQEKISIENDGTLLIKKNGEGYFPSKTYRKMTRIEPGLYEFSESDLTKVRRTGFSSRYLPLHLEGLITEYHANGEVKSLSRYKNNQLISNQNWLSNGDSYIDTIFYSADSEPEYKLGPKFFHTYILENLYNSDIDINQITDVVEVAWVVMEDGSMDGVITLKGRSLQLNQFLVNTIAALPGDWQPAMLNGKAVRYFISVPLNFEQLEVSFQDLELSGGVMHYNKY